MLLLFLLQAFGADIFFDDQDVHLNLSSNVVPSAKVLNKNIMLSEKNK